MAAREILLVVAILTILFGLVVSLARRVRAEAAFSLVRREMIVLEEALIAYMAEHDTVPQAPAIFPAELDRASEEEGEGSASMLPRLETRAAGPEDEIVLAERAYINNRATIRALGIGARRFALTQQEGDTDSVINGVSALLFDGSTLRDPWGQPIAFMASGRPEVGYATENRPFFFSAGPDGRYLTLLDNIYSYEVLAGRVSDPEETDPDIPDFPIEERLEAGR